MYNQEFRLLRLISNQQTCSITKNIGYCFCFPSQQQVIKTLDYCVLFKTQHDDNGRHINSSVSTRDALHDDCSILFQNTENHIHSGFEIVKPLVVIANGKPEKRRTM